MAVGWQHYEHVVIERHEHGVLQIAVAGPDPTPCEIVRQHAPVGTRTVRWVCAAKASNATELPELPSANAYAADAVLLTRVVHGQSAVPCDRGVYLYVFFGEYTYALLRARPVDGDFPLGNLPPSMAQPGDAVAILPAAKFKRYLDTGNLAPAPRGVS